MEVLKLESRKYSKQEFLELLKDSEHKLELDRGEITMMAGATRAHNDVADNLFAALRSSDSGCYIKSSDTAISIQKTNSYFFPDISATCEEPEFEEGGIARLINPQLLIEVLSISTEKRDRSIKWDAYVSLPSLKEYVLIDSKSMMVQSFYRHETGSWKIGNWHKPEQEIEFKTLKISVPMMTIYEGVTFPKLED